MRAQSAVPLQTHSSATVFPTVSRNSPLRWRGRVLRSSGSLLRSPVKIGTIPRRLAWPLRKDDTHKSRSVNNSFDGPPCLPECSRAGSNGANCASVRHTPRNPLDLTRFTKCSRIAQTCVVSRFGHNCAQRSAALWVGMCGHSAGFAKAYLVRISV